MRSQELAAPGFERASDVSTTPARHTQGRQLTYLSTRPIDLEQLDLIARLAR